MTTLGIFGLGGPELLMLAPVALLLLFSPIMWIQERRQRKYWQAKAEDYEKRLLDKK